MKSSFHSLILFLPLFTITFDWLLSQFYTATQLSSPDNCSLGNPEPHSVLILAASDSPCIASGQPPQRARFPNYSHIDMEVCLPSRSLAMDVSSDFTIPAFGCHVILYICITLRIHYKGKSIGVLREMIAIYFLNHKNLVTYRLRTKSHKLNSVAFSPQANYTDRATVACRRS
jgi:hypothetical protein